MEFLGLQPQRPDLASGQKSTGYDYFSGSVSANRVTPEWKIRTSAYISRSEDRFTYEDETISSVSKSRSFSGLVAKSLGEHWSVGAYLAVSTSTYNNLKLSVQPAPAIEYDVFPYSQSTRRQFSFLYRLNFQAAKYYEERFTESGPRAYGTKACPSLSA